MRYFIDESGNSGDVVKSGRRFDFDGQPVFVLACVGIEDEEALSAELTRLKAAYSVSPAELKSASLAKRPEMVGDLIAYLEHIDAPVMIEAVDKRYYICTNIVSRQLLPMGGEMEADPRVRFLRKAFAERLSRVISDETLDLFLAACRLPGRETVRASLVGLQNAVAGETELAQAMSLAAKDRLEELDRDNSEDAHLDFLPIPDDNKAGKAVWMLPNLSSFTNIYARINLAHHGEVGGLQLVHDEQVQFDNILQQAKAQTDTLHEIGVLPYTPFADYRFSQSGDLMFAVSHDNPGIQMADALAGFVMRYLKIGARKAGPPQGPGKTVMDALISLADPRGGTGINFVVPDSTLHKLRIPYL